MHHLFFFLYLLAAGDAIGVSAAFWSTLSWQLGDAVSLPGAIIAPYIFLSRFFASAVAHIAMAARFTSFGAKHSKYTFQELSLVAPFRDIVTPGKSIRAITSLVRPYAVVLLFPAFNSVCPSTASWRRSNWAAAQLLLQGCSVFYISSSDCSRPI